MDELREREIKIAKVMGYRVEKGTLMAPENIIPGRGYYIGKFPDLPDLSDLIWNQCTPRFSQQIDWAFSILDFIQKTWGIDYNLFNEGDFHTCEIGHWSNEPGERDALWAATEDTPALAIIRAVEKCEIIMEKTENE